MDGGTLLNFGLVLVFVLVGGVFAGTEMALVSLRESQVSRLEQQSKRGARVAAVARDPNRFLAAVQIGVTVAGFLSAAFGASTLAPDLAPYLVDVGVPSAPADTIALVVMTLFIAYLSLVLGELVPKRFALQKSAGMSMIVGPPLDRFANLMRPVIWLLSVSTNGVVRLLGGDPAAVNDEMSEEELRDLVSGHEGLGEDERRILSDVFAATQRSVKEVMKPRGEVVFIDGDVALSDAARDVRGQPYSRYPVTGHGGIDDVIGFLHVRDLYAAFGNDSRTVREVMRDIVVLPSTNQLLPAISLMRSEGKHMALVVDEYGGTDGIVTLEDLVEELVGEIRDEHDRLEEAPSSIPPGEARTVEGGLNIEDFAEATGVVLEDGPYETVGGYVVAQLGRMAEVGDVVTVGDHSIEVTAVDRLRIAEVTVQLLDT